MIITIVHYSQLGTIKDVSETEGRPSNSSRSKHITSPNNIFYEDRMNSAKISDLAGHYMFPDTDIMSCSQYPSCA